MPSNEVVYELWEEELIRKVDGIKKKGTARTEGLFQFKN